MQVTLNIGYDQVFDLVKQLSPEGRERIVTELSRELEAENAVTRESIEKNRQEALRLALEFPVATPEEIEEYNEFRRQFRCRPM